MENTKSSVISENFCLSWNYAKVKQCYKVWKLDEMCKNAKILLKYFTAGIVQRSGSPLSNTGVAPRWCQLKLNFKKLKNYRNKVENIQLQKRGNYIKKNWSKKEKTNMKELTFITLQLFILQQQANVTWKCLPNNAMLNGKCILPFPSSSSPGWVRMISTKVTGIVHQPGGEKKTWRMTNNSPAGLASCN